MVELIIIAAAVVILIGFISYSYRKVPINKALSVSGAFLKQPKIIVGGATVVVPFLQIANIIDMSQFTLKVSVEDANTDSQVPLDIEGTATLRIGNTSEMVRSAMQSFLTLKDDERNEQIVEVVKGQIRGVLGKMQPEDVSNKRDAFASQVQESVGPILAKMGIEIVSVQISKVADKNGYIDSLYVKEVADRKSEAKQNEAIAAARARKVAAEQNSLANQAEQESEQNIAVQNKETAVKKAQLKKEQDEQTAIADQAYPLSKAQQEKAVNEAQGAANVAKAEQDAKLAAQQVAINESKYQSEITAKAKAEAAAKVEQASADANVTKINANAEAEKISNLGNAEADIIAKKGLAEAEAISKRGNAYANNGQLLLTNEFIKQLPDVIGAYAKPLSEVKNMNVYDGAQGVTGQSAVALQQMISMVKDTTGLDLQELIKAKGYGTITVDTSNKTAESVKSIAKSLQKPVKPNKTDKS
ncbi:flotillin family protein [Xylocopilactobacillus apicola]|uniref:Flotillin n=1 Tax=Xylocopilactobacillus apicola TaxID=2932184 RepID=A0AAU9CWT2_9LACO|nr:SPFH domain-containing protein [Xylocopilactobacillus apicola]BDR58447.1 flotillin [Xylocopilactobacillus apicola]